MLRVASLVLAIGLVSLAGSVSAAEVITECPRFKPDDPRVPFRYGEIMPAGDGYWVWLPDETYRADGLLYTLDIYRKDAKTDPLLKAILVCQYRDRSELRLPVPGALLRCGMTIREISRKPPVIHEWLRVWCASEATP